jgi:FkbM family methyltransferase
MLSMKLRALASVMLSTVVSVLDRRLTLARWDGEDWQFKWSDGCLYSHSHQTRPKALTRANIDLYLTMYKPKLGDTILEVGAGSGTEVCSLSNMVGQTGKIVAVEADPTAVRLLRKQAKALRYRNVTVVEAAVGAEECTVELYVDEPAGIINSTAAIVGRSSVTVQCRPLRDILNAFDIEAVSYMKMNIEGAEYDALIGLGSAIERVREIFISCHDFTGIPAQTTFQKVYNYLESQGLRLTTLPLNLDAPWEQYYIFARWVPADSH